MCIDSMSSTVYTHMPCTRLELCEAMKNGLIKIKQTCNIWSMPHLSDEYVVQ